jgi:hypothetical protein
VKKKILFLIFENYKKKKNIDNIFFKEINSKFKVKIVDISFLKKKKTFKKEVHYPKNFYEIKELIQKKNSVFISYLENNINTFRFLNLIHKNKKKLYKISNSAALEQYKFILNKDLFSNIKKLFKYKFKRKIFEIINIILIYLNLLPKFDIIFECSQNKIRKYNKIIFKKIIRINSNTYDRLIYNKTSVKREKIVFLDSNFSHNDRICLDSNPSNKQYIEYLHQLKRLFEIIEIKFNSKIIICLHPTTDIKMFKSIFEKNKIIKGKTDFYVKKAKLLLFHESSSVLDAIILNKKIINLQSALMGKYFQYRNELYNKEIKLKKIKLEDKFINIKEINTQQQKVYKSFIKNNLTNNIKQYNQLKKINFKINNKNFIKLKKETGAYKAIENIL